jgi:Tat protein translocase TatB subunit
VIGNFSPVTGHQSPITKNMFGMGFGELLVVLIVALIFLGPEKIPQTARTLGKWLHELKGTMDDVRNAFEKDINEPSKNIKEKVKEFVQQELPKDPPPP